LNLAILFHFVENKIQIKRNKTSLSKCSLTELWSKGMIRESVKVVKDVSLSNFVHTKTNLFADAFLKFVLEFLENTNIKRLDKMC
jgi:hypothetical protein